MSERRCQKCQSPNPDKGRAIDGRRAYRCKKCGHIWTEGLQGRERSYSPQRRGYQFHDTGAYKQPDPMSEPEIREFLGID